MDVTVVILARDACPHLPAALASVVAQTTTRRLEIVLANAAAEPLPAELTGDYLGRYTNPLAKITCKLVQSEEPTAPAALNAALACSAAPYVAFLQAEDYWDRFRLERQFAAMRQGPHVGAVHTAYRRIDEHGAFLDEEDVVHGADNPCAGGCLPWLLAGSSVVFSSLLVRRPVVEQAAVAADHGQPFAPDCVIAYEDEFLLRLSRVGQFVFIPQPLTHVGPPPGAAMRLNSPAALMNGNPPDNALPARLEARCRVRLNFIEQHADELRLDPDTVRDRLGQLLANQVRYLLAHGQPHPARRLCDIAHALDLAREPLAELERRARRPAWWLTVTEAARRWWGE